MRTALLAILVIAGAIGLAAPVPAADAPPSIDDLNGATFVLRAKVTEHDLAGEQFKYTVEITTTLTKTGPTTIAMSSVFGGMSFSSHYVDGFLIPAVHFEPG